MAYNVGGFLTITDRKLSKPQLPIEGGPIDLQPYQLTLMQVPSQLVSELLTPMT
jgi:hypothetical protein